MDLVETISPFAQWRRWWGNTKTKQLFVVDYGEHDEFAEENIEQFLDPNTINELYSKVGEWWVDNDSWLEAIYAAGWQAILWDGTDQSLMMRFQSQSEQRSVSSIAAKIAKQVPVESLFIDTEESGVRDESYELRGPELKAFLKTGKLPA